MDNADGVRGFERTGRAYRDLYQLQGWHWPLLHAFVKRLAVEQLHRELQAALPISALEYVADVGVLQHRGSPAFALEAVRHLGIVRHLFCENLERSDVPEPYPAP
jgi:hypothetical protein